jgi:SKI/SNO/DAC family/c-SKI Smad4 binding domain
VLASEYQKSVKIVLRIFKFRSNHPDPTTSDDASQSSEMTEFVPPTIRTVLKTYQDSAVKSLQGPGLSLVHPHKRELDSPDLSEPPHIAHLPPPELPQPILSAPDPEHGSLQETTLEGKRIGCYMMGGEMRLCFPQILNNILTDFKIDQIYRVFDELHIFCSQCTPEQLNEFKTAKILPDDTKASGLITRTNAERLCSALLHRPDTSARTPKGALSFRVYHRCFGKCEGVCSPEMYSFKEPACIECTECRGMFSPQMFVCHAHRPQENQTCHWGFDSGNWRAYLHVALDEKNREDFTKILDNLKEREIQDAALYLLNQRDLCHLKRKVGKLNRNFQALL